MRLPVIFIAAAGFIAGSLEAHAFSKSGDPRLMLPVGHTAAITDIKITADLKYMISASEDNTVKLTHLRWGTTLINFDRHRAAVNSIDLSRDEQSVLTASEDSFIFEFHLKSGKILHYYKLPGPVDHAVFSPDNSLIFCYTSNGYYRMIQRETGEPLWYNEKWKNFNSAALSPDGLWVILDCGEYIEVLSAATGKTHYRSHAHSGRITSLAFNSESTHLMTTSQDSTAKVWNLSTGELIFTLSGHKDELNYGTFSPDGNYLATASDDKTACIWDAADGKQLYCITGFYHWVEKIEFSQATGNIIVEEAGRTGEPSLYSCKLFNGSEKKGIANSEENIEFWSLSPTGKSVIFGCLTGSVFVCDSDSGDLIADFSGSVRHNGQAYTSPDGKYMLTDGGTGLAHVWDIRQGKIIKTIYDSMGIYNASMDKSGKFILTNAFENHIILHEIATGRAMYRLHAPGFIRFCFISDDNKYIIANTDDFHIFVWNFKDGSLVSEMDCDANLFHLLYNAVNATLVTAYFSNYGTGDLQLWDIHSGKMIRYFNDSIYGNQQTVIDISVDGKFIITGTNSSDNNIAIITSDLKEKVYSGRISPNAESVSFLKNHELILISSDHILQVLSWKNQRVLFEKSSDKKDIFSAFRTVVTNKTHNTFAIASGNGQIELFSIQHEIPELVFSDTLNCKVNFIAFGPADSFLIISGSDYTYRYLDLQNQHNHCTMITLGFDDYITLTSEGYYRATPGAAYQLYYVDDSLNIITFEQLDIRSNRPDKVLQSLGYGDTTMIRAYYHAHSKRLTKLGLQAAVNNAEYSLPVSEFKNRYQIPERADQNKLTLHIHNEDAFNELERFNLWVNDVPCFGVRGISLRSRKTHVFDTTIVIGLNYGSNRVESGILNVAGLENYRTPVYVSYLPEKASHSKIYFIGFGIDRFADSTYNLRYSVKDIRDLSAALKKRYGDTLISETYFNENITADHLHKIKKRLLQTKVDDKVIIAYSGHGLLSKELDYYLSTYTVNFEHPETNGLPYEDLENLLDSIPARQKLLLIDACHSGEVDKEEMLHMYAIADSLGLSKGTKVTNIKKETKTMGLQNSFELMQNLFVNVGKGTGATVISASAGTQFALERGDLKNGVFTYSILEAMAMYPALTVSQLKWSVGLRVVELTRGMQKPTSRNETINNDWRVW